MRLKIKEIFVKNSFSFNPFAIIINNQLIKYNQIQLTNFNDFDVRNNGMGWIFKFTTHSYPPPLASFTKYMIQLT